MMDFHGPQLLNALIFLPLVGAFVVLALPGKQEGLIRWTSLGFAFAELVLTCVLWRNFDMLRAEDFQFMYPKDLWWIPELGVKYKVGVDGLSLPLVILTSFSTVVAIGYSFVPIKTRIKEYFALFLLLEVGMMGTFLSLDIFLFYVFWEISLVPMFLIIGIWGGPRREYAAIKFFLYTLIGSLAMLLAILALYFTSEDAGSPTGHTFDVTWYLNPRNRDGLKMDPKALVLCFWAFYLAFAIKVPAWPFHTWLPDAHVEAPTGGSIILAAVLLKMGTYGLLRFCLPMFPDAARGAAPVLMVIAIINIIYGSFVAMAQTDLKKLVAYSSVGHMGFVLLGFASAAQSVYNRPDGVSPEMFELGQVTALNGAVFQMISHGIITGGLFLLVGVIYERSHHRDIDRYGGLAVAMPQYYGVTTFMCFASLGLPPLAGFIGEFAALAGAFTVWRWLAGICVIGVVVTAAYFLWLLQRVFLGELNPKYQDYPDLTKHEKLCLAPLVLATFLLGVWPKIVLEPVDPAMQQIVRVMGRERVKSAQLP